MWSTVKYLINAISLNDSPRRIKITKRYFINHSFALRVERRNSLINDISFKKKKKKNSYT